MSNRIVILGGGTAGWMTAAYLVKALRNVEGITVIDSPNIRTIGVGEATFSTIKLFFDFLELEEKDWMPHCSAAYKLAIRFVDWTAGGGHFYHPFQRYPTASGFNLGEWWLRSRNGVPFDYSCFLTPWLCDALRSPRYLDGTVFDRQVRPFYTPGERPPNATISGHQVQYPYAYHFNAAELAEFLRGYAMERGVQRIADEVLDVVRSPDGSIQALQTKEHGALAGDLFVDCSGFRGLLLNKLMNEPFVAFSDSLLNDSAVAIQVPRDIEREGIRPYTTATAHNAGWSWNIPLYGRDGTGYVYCSQFIDSTEAEREFREFLGPAAEGCVANHIKMRIGRSRNSWVKNCVAIGLASGFVEPLESTGIFFIQHGIEELVNHFPGPAGIDPGMVASYNKVINECIDGVREFLTLHYLAGDRVDTPFWQAVKQIRVPDGLRERMELWKSRLPCPRSIYQAFHGFESYSWSVMLLGLNYRPAHPRGILDQIEGSEAQAVFESVKSEARRLTQTLPSQYEYLTQMRTIGGSR